MLNIVAADDTPQVADAMVARIEEALSVEANVTALSGEPLKEGIRKLRERESKWSEDSDWHPPAYKDAFDTADVVVLDYRLAELYGEDAFMTGEDVAALARRHSRAGPIVSVNRFGERRFDLRLRSQHEAWADLSVAHEDLSNPGLWSLVGEGEYRPWGWPPLSTLPALFEARVRFVSNHLDRIVAEVLGFSPGALNLMPREVSEALDGDLATMTFRDVAMSRAFRSQVPVPSGPQIARVAAAEVGKWLSGYVLPGQETLIDAPHLIVQYPSLLVGEPELDVLNSLTQLDPNAELPISEVEIGAARFAPANWLDRPAWWTERILEERRLPENLRPWEKTKIDQRFAEDTSSFHVPDDCTAFEAVGALGQGYVRRPDSGVTYQPFKRLLG